MKLDIVIPIYNEEETLAELRSRLTATLDALDGVDWRVLYVNDGSRDGSLELIAEQCRENPRFGCLDLSRNFGHQAAVSAGLDHAGGDAVVVMDGDLQDPPELVASFLQRWRDGYEIVYALRRKRKEALLKRLAYAAFYRLLRWMAKIDVPLDAGDFSLLDARVVEVLRSMPEHNRFIRGLRSWVGFRSVGVEYERDARFAGQSKYSLSGLLRLAMSGFVGFSTFPLRLAVWLGFLAAGVGFSVAAWATIYRLLGLPAPVGWASTVAVILFVGGVQLLVLGVIGEYLGAVYDEVRRRPVYIARGFIGGEEPARPARPAPADH